MKRVDVERSTILVAKAGSHAYGTNTPYSDVDVRGIFVANEDHYFGLHKIEQKDGGWLDESDTGIGEIPILGTTKDTCLYELSKYIRLASNCNPNILEMVWQDKTTYYFLSELGQELIAHKQLFLSQQCRQSYLGYAYSQLKRLENHRKWLLDPPKAPPSINDYGLDEWVPLSKEEMNAFLEFLYLLVRNCVEFMQPAEDLYELLLERIDYKGILKQHEIPTSLLPTVRDLTRSREDFISLLHKSQLYRSDLGRWRDYQHWLAGRNTERAALELKVGYDSKHASHLYRLLIQAKEILRDHVLVVDRRVAGDAEFLLNIRNANVPYEEVMAGAELLFSEVKAMESTLNKRVDINEINSLLVYLVRSSLLC